MERAAALSADAARQLPAFVRLLESVLAGRATAGEIEAGLGAAGDRRPGFEAALDAALRAGVRAEPAFTAARAVLCELPRALHRLLAQGHDEAGEAGIAAALEGLAARERELPDRRRCSPWKCPRCGSRRIETQYTTALGPRLYDARCIDCGQTGSWTEGDQDAATWQADGLLAATFAEYLRGGAVRPGPLADALRNAGWRLEGSLLEREGWHADGDWARVFVGRRPPHDAVPGEVWLDTVEVMPMVLVEEPTWRPDRPTRPVWLAVRPVARWQLHAFVAAAPFARRTVMIELPVRMFDPVRLTGDENLPITSILPAEAELYALWFGKVPTTRDAWQGAVRTLGARAASLWHPGLREWIGELCSFDEGLRARIGPDEVGMHPDDDYVAMRDDGAEPRMLAGEATFAPDTGLRTVAGQTLLTGISDTFRPFVPITLDRVFAR